MNDEKMIFGTPVQEEILKDRKWYWRTSTFVTALLCAGPLALPLLWLNPHVSRKSKAVVTVCVLIASYFLIKWMLASINHIVEYYKNIF